MNRPYLKTISAKGLSADFAHDLDRVTVFTGSSFSGKTTRLAAIRLALGGNDPDSGKTGEATMGLARNGHISVTVEASDDRSMTRNWNLKGESVRATTKGDLDPTPAVLLDANEYFSRSDAKKIEYVFGLCDLGDDSEFSGQAIIASLKGLPIEGENEHTVELLRSCVAELDDSDTQRHRQGTPIQEWLAEEIKRLKELLKVERATCQRMTKTVEGITQITASEAPAANHAPEIEERRKKLAELDKTLGSLTQLLADYGEARKRIDTLETKLAKTPVVEIPDVSAKLQEIERDMRLHGEETQLETTYETLCREISGKFEALRKERREYESATPEHQRTVTDLNGKLARVKNLIEGVDLEFQKLDRILETKLNRPCCPECGTETKAASDLILRGHNARKEELETSRAGHKKEAAQLDKQIKAATTKLQKAQRADQANDAKLDRISELMQEHGKKSSARVESINKRNRAIHTLSEERKRLERSVECAQEQNHDHTDLQKELTRARETLAEFNLEALTQRKVETEAQRVQLQQAIVCLEEKQRAFQRAKDDEQRNAAALLEHAKSKAEVNVLKAIVEKLETTQGKMVEMAFGKLLGMVNDFTRGIMPAAIEYRDGRLGYFVGSTWVTHKYFSGTEKALVYAGLSAALAEGAPCLTVIVDELGRMDRDTLVKFLKRMVELTQSGRIAQFIGCYSATPNGGPGVPGVKEIRL